MDHRSARRQIPAEIVFVGYRDPAAEVCFGPDDPYGLECLVSVVGPSSYLMWVNIARRVLAEGGPVRFDVVDLFRSIGLGQGTDRNSAGVRTLARMTTFGMLRATPNPDLLAVCTEMPALPARQLARLTQAARRYHYQRCGGARP
jgi:hypothetical protein